MKKFIGCLLLLTVSATPTFAAAADKDAFPAFTQGNGSLGYGKPNKVIADTAAWKHPTQKAIATLNGATVRRIEFYNGGTYPVFFVALEASSTSYRHLQFHDTGRMNGLAARVLKANAGWAFELVDSTGGPVSHQC